MPPILYYQQHNNIMFTKTSKTKIKIFIALLSFYKIFQISNAVAQINSAAYAISDNNSVALTYTNIDSNGNKYEQAQVQNATNVLYATLPSNISTRLVDISADGKIAVGYSFEYVNGVADESTFRAIKFENNSITYLESDFYTILHSYATGISADGQIIGGTAQLNDRVAIIIYQNGIMNAISSSSLYATSQGISSDGTTFVGSIRFGADPEAIIYEPSVKLLRTTNAIGYAIADDNNTMVGQTYSNNHAFIKTFNNSLIDIGSLIPATSSFAKDISSDGRVVIGQAVFNSGGTSSNQSFKYENGAITMLPTLGGTNTYANAISRDGSIIVGASDTVDGATHAFITRTNSLKMVDLQNTTQSFALNASAANSVINLDNALLNASLNQDAYVFGKNNLSVEIGARQSQASMPASDKLNQVAATLKVAYRFNKYMRAGVYMDQGISNNLSDNYKIQNSLPLLAAFTTFTQRQDNSGAKLHLAVAYNNYDLSIKRQTLDNTEAGVGESNLKAFGALAELSYGFKFFEDVILQPYVGLRQTKITRGQYSETAGADFPVTYKAMSLNSLTAISGLRLGLTLSQNLRIKLAGGYEHDLKNSFDDFAGGGDYLGSFAIKNQEVRKNRPTANFALAYNLTPDQVVAAETFISKQQFGNKNSVVNYLTYKIGF